jgi:hypothetical protein
MNIKFESQEGFLLATLAGPVSLKEAIEFAKNIYDTAAERGFGKVLVDCLAVDGALSVVDRYELGEEIAEYCKNRSMIPSVALLGKPPLMTGFYAQVAWNRGVLVKAFSERQAAVEWFDEFGSRQPRRDISVDLDPVFSERSNLKRD